MEDHQRKIAWDEGNKIMHTNFQGIRSGANGDDWVLFVSDQQPIKEGWLENPYFSQQLIEMNCTGVKDGNGIFYFEGHIVKVPGGVNFQVGFNSETGSYCLKSKNGDPVSDHLFGSTYGEIIGNIHENPELLK